MGRVTSYRRKRNKASKSAKLFWKKRNDETMNLTVQQLFHVDTQDLLGDSCLSEPPVPVEEFILQDEIDNDDESEVQRLVASIPKWGNNKYEPRKPPQNRDGIMSFDEYESIQNHQLCYEPAICEPSPVSGNRIAELGYVIEACLKTQYRHLQKCTGGLIKLKEEKPLKGLISVMILECTQCNRIFEVTTESSTKQTSTINAGAVWGTIATGSSYSHLQELLSCMDVPNMSTRTFYDLENKMGLEWRQSLEKSMAKAGLQEKENALSKNQITTDGTPWITVYVDGSWSKRSYGTNYNSLSGMVGIIGKFTGQLLYIAVRNKYCSVCARATNSAKTPIMHTCYKNWTGSSTGMEPDMVVSGFSESVATHGVKYTKFIADGDSSVFARIKEQVPYGHEVQKIECTNHAMKNYGKNLRKIKLDKNISSAGRKLLSNKFIELLTKRAKCSIYEHSRNGTNISLLQDDLRNGIFHVFGDHTKCREDICNTVGMEINNKIPELKSSLVYNHIIGALNLLVRKASLLIQNETNNHAERLMNIVARFNMGKRLNLVQRGSYERRVHLSGLRFNKSLKWHLSPWKRFTGKSPGKNFSSYINKNSKQRKRNRCRRKLFSNEKEINRDYGVQADEPEEDGDIIVKEAQLLMQQLKVTEEERKLLSERTIGQFGNPHFEEERRLRLTSSLFGRIINKRPSTSCHGIVKSCLYPQKIHSEAVEYGLIKEDIAISLFEKEKKIKVTKSGLWVDSDFGFLGASPDGLIAEKNAVVEVKCLWSFSKENFTSIEQIVDTKPSKICLEKINGKLRLKRKHSYFYQVQGQLNICQRDTCFFVVYVNDQIKLYIEEIQRDETLWKTNMLPVLVKFYEDCIAPEIIRNNIKKGKKCVDPPYIVEAQVTKERGRPLKKISEKTEDEEEIILMFIDSE